MLPIFICAPLRDDVKTEAPKILTHESKQELVASALGATGGAPAQESLSMCETPPVFMCAMPNCATMRVHSSNAMLSDLRCKFRVNAFFLQLQEHEHAKLYCHQIFSWIQLRCMLWGLQNIETIFKCRIVSKKRWVQRRFLAWQPATGRA